jgi:hypothetical protein
MNTWKQKWFGSWLSRLLELLSRGGMPVDGFTVEPKKPPKPRNPEPVRWGNFR